MSNNTKKITTFISYASEDMQLATCINHFLQDIFEDELDIFIDVKIKVGESWKDQIAEKLYSSKIFILLISQKSIKSINVAKEVATIAVKCLEYKNGDLVLNKTDGSDTLFLPIIIEDIDFIFTCIKKNFQYQDFRNPYDLYEQLKKLARSVRAHIDGKNAGKQEQVADENKESLYIESFSKIRPEWRSNDYRKIQFISKALNRPIMQLLAKSNRKLDKFFDYNNTSNILLAPHSIPYKEKTPKQEIWVISENLNNDLYEEAIAASVQSNMRDRGITYRYFVRKSKKEYLSNLLNNRGPSKLDGKYHIVALPDNTFLPFEELVIYDPKNEELRSGYMQMTYDDSKENKPVFVLCPSQLVDESVEFLKNCYSHKDKPNENVCLNNDQSNNKNKAENEINTKKITEYLHEHFNDFHSIEIDLKENSLIKYFLISNGKQQDKDNTEQIPAERIVKNLMEYEPLKMRTNHNLDLEQQSLARALQLIWSFPNSNIGSELGYSTSDDNNFFNNFVGKIDDLNSVRRTQDSLATLQVMSIHERAAKDEVMVISPLLHNDLLEKEVRGSIIENVESIIRGHKNLHYCYFYFCTQDREPEHNVLKGRNSDLYSSRRQAHEDLYTRHIKRLLEKYNIDEPKSTTLTVEKHWYNNIFHFYHIPHNQVIFPFNEIVVFDPNDNQCNLGYVLLNYGDNRIRKVAIKLPQRMLAKICNTLLLYRKEYGTH